MQQSTHTWKRIRTTGIFVMSWAIVLGTTLSFAQQPRIVFHRPIVVSLCSIVPHDDVEVHAKVPGTLEIVSVRKFDRVKAGQVIARVDDSLAQIEVESKKAIADNNAPVEQAILTKEERDAELEEKESLGRIASKSDKRLAKARVGIAKAGVKDAKEQQGFARIDLKSAQAQLQMHNVVSPIDGVVMEVLKETGEAVEAREKVVRVISTDKVKIEGAVSVQDAEHLRRGMIVEIFPNKTLASTQHYRHTDEVTSVRVLSDGRRVASGSADGSIVIWNVERHAYERELRGHSGAVHCLAASPRDPNVLVSGGDGREILVWDIAAETSRAIRTNGKSMLCATIDPSNPNVLITGHEDKMIRIWSLDTGEELKELSPLSGHRSFVTSVAVTPNGKYLVSAGDDYTIRVWDLANGKQIHEFRNRSRDIHQIGLSNDGKSFLFNSYSVLQVRSIADGNLMTSIESPSESFAGVAVFAPAPGFILTAGANTYDLQLWRQPVGQRPARLVRTFEGHEDKIGSVDFSADGTFFVSGGADKDRSVRIWEVPSAEEVERERKTSVINIHRTVELGSEKMSFYAVVDNTTEPRLEPGRFATVIIYPIDKATQAKLAK